MSKTHLNPRTLRNISGHGLSVMALALLAACGGGGGDDAPASGGDTPAAPTVLQPEGAMRVQGTRILSAKGKPFVIRGINLQYGDNPTERLPMIDEIAATGANTIRLQLRKNTTADQLRAALDKIVAKGLVAVVMYWETDVTCTSDANGFATALDRWTNTWKSVLSDPKYRANLILNIANEWGESDSTDTFGNTYRDAIGKLRAAGYQFPLMIDAAHCGQQYDVFLSGRAARIAAADKYANVIFSTHAYWSYQQPVDIDAAVNAITNQGLPFVWGEFGQADFQGANATNHRYLIRQAEATSTGYTAWSWYGNGSDAKVLDMREAGATVVLTAYGQEVVEGGASFKGIRATAVPLDQ